MTLDDLDALAARATPGPDSLAFDLAIQRACVDLANACTGPRIAALIACVRAADALRDGWDEDAEAAAMRDFDAARAKLEEL